MKYGKCSIIRLLLLLAATFITSGYATASNSDYLIGQWSNTNEKNKDCRTIRIYRDENEYKARLKCDYEGDRVPYTDDKVFTLTPMDDLDSSAHKTGAFFRYTEASNEVLVILEAEGGSIDLTKVEIDNIHQKYKISKEVYVRKSNYLARDFFRDAQNKELVFEVDYCEGFEPDEKALLLFRDYISTLISKSMGIRIELDQKLNRLDCEVLSQSTIVAENFQKFRNLKASSDSMIVYVIYLYDLKSNYAEADVDLSTIIISKNAIETMRSMLGNRKDINPSEIETMLLTHEFGHIMGDDKSNAHCPNPKCVMAGQTPQSIDYKLKEVVKNRHVPFTFCDDSMIIIEEYNDVSPYEQCLSSKDCPKLWETIDGKIEGWWIEWHDDKTKKAMGKYRQGKKYGLWDYWYDNGGIMLEGFYDNEGVSKGKWIFWPRDKKDEPFYAPMRIDHDGKERVTSIISVYGASYSYPLNNVGWTLEELSKVNIPYNN